MVERKVSTTGSMNEHSEEQITQPNAGGIMNVNETSQAIDGEAKTIPEQDPAPDGSSKHHTKPPSLHVKEERRQNTSPPPKMEKPGSNSDLECGEIGDDGSKEENLANAFMVADCSHLTDLDNSFFPIGVEFDPMAKERAHARTRHCVYVAWVALLAVVLMVGLTLGLLFREDPASERSVRETQEIRETLERATGVSLTTTTHRNPDPSQTPYLQALDWILHTDPMASTPADANLLQRFLVAYLYFATSTDHEWAWCAPPTPYSGNACTFQEVHRNGLGHTKDVRGSRWLSGTNECTWVGLYCNKEMQIEKINLSKSSMVWCASVEQQDISLSSLSSLPPLFLEYM